MIRCERKGKREKEGVSGAQTLDPQPGVEERHCRGAERRRQEKREEKIEDEKALIEVFWKDRPENEVDGREQIAQAGRNLGVKRIPHLDSVRTRGVQGRA